MTTITGSMIPSGDEILWYAGGVHIVNEEQTEVGGLITLTNTAEYGSVVVLDADGAPSTQCLEMFDAVPATQTSGTNKVQTTAAGTDKMYADYVAIAGAGAALTEVLASKDVSFKMTAAEFSEAIQGQLDEVQKTGAIKWTMSLSMMKASDDFAALAFGSKIASSPASGFSKQHTVSGAINELGVLVGTRYVSGVAVDKYYCMACNAKSSTLDLPASGFVAESFDFTVASKREMHKA